MKRYLTDEWLHKIYKIAYAEVFRETGLEFPETCPYVINDVLNRSLSLALVLDDIADLTVRDRNLTNLG